MKRIIALTHSSNKGKTCTLIELGNLLLAEPAVDILYCDQPVSKNEKLPPSKDITLAVKLFCKVVGIVSQGDPNTDLKNRLQEVIDNYKVDYLFCATRTRGETVVDVYETLGSTAYEKLWTSTYYSDNGEENEAEANFLNKLKAKHLLDLLKELILND